MQKRVLGDDELGVVRRHDDRGAVLRVLARRGARARHEGVEVHARRARDERADREADLVEVLGEELPGEPGQPALAVGDEQAVAEIPTDTRAEPVDAGVEALQSQVREDVVVEIVRHETLRLTVMWMSNPPASLKGRNMFDS